MSFLNIAHRGASLDAAENTLEAFELAIEQGADMIETDLHLTRDGAIVLRHDSAYEGDEIGGLTLAELRERLPRVPTLQEAMDAVGERIPFNLEIKRPPEGTYGDLETRVMKEVCRRSLVSDTLFSCFTISVLKRIRELEERARVALLVGTPGDIEMRARHVGAEAVHLPLRLTTPEGIAGLQACSWRVHVYTVDDPEDQRRLIDWGVDGIFTNAPGRLASVVGQ